MIKHNDKSDNQFLNASLKLIICLAILFDDNEKISTHRKEINRRKDKHPNIEPDAILRFFVLCFSLRSKHNTKKRKKAPARKRCG